MQDKNSNPYATPDAPVMDVPSEGPELASFGIRLLGAIIDGILMMLLVFPLLFAFGFMSINDIMAGIQPTFVDNLKMGTIGFVVFLLVQGYFLNASGQTIGKKILGTKIVTLDNEKPEFVKLILMRYLTVHAIGQVPFIGGIFGFVNAIFIFFGDQRQCLHDRFAGTKVVLTK